MHSQCLHLNTNLENVPKMSPSSLPCTLKSFSSQCPSNHSLENVDESHSSNHTFSICALYFGRQSMVFAISSHWSTQEFFITSTPPRWNHLSKPQSDIEGPEVVIEQTQSSKLKYTSWNTLWFTYDFAPRRPCWSMQQIVQKIEICGLNNSLLQKC
jgi:hypothetical protein